jgi:hypothetical protein
LPREHYRHAMLVNPGTLIYFCVGPEDASFLALEFAPTSTPSIS